MYRVTGGTKLHINMVLKGIREDVMELAMLTERGLQPPKDPNIQRSGAFPTLLPQEVTPMKAPDTDTQ